jgi:hypothetical protein
VFEYEKDEVQFSCDPDLELSRNECVKEEEWRHMTSDTAVTTMEGIQIFVLCGFIH